MTKRPQFSRNPIAVLTFNDGLRVIKLGAKRTLTVDDLWELKGASKTEKIAEKVLAQDPKKSLLKRLVSLSPGMIAAALILAFFNMVLNLVPSLILPQLISWLEFDPTKPPPGPNETLPVMVSPPPLFTDWYWGWICVGIIAGATILAAFCEAHSIRCANEVAARFRAAIVLLIYNRALSASMDAAPPSGQVMTLLTSDLSNVGLNTPVVFMYSMTIFQLIFVLVLLWLQIGPYALISIGILILVLPIGGYFGNRMTNMFTKKQSFTDQRMKLITELITAIRIVKFYAWEAPILETIMKVRKIEIGMLYKALLTTGYFFAALGAGPMTAMSATFIIYGIYGHPSLSVIFTMLNLLMQINYVFFMIPIVVQSAAQLMASFGRIQKYLDTPLAPPSNMKPSSDSDPPRVVVSDATFYWSTPGVTRVILEEEKPKGGDKETTGTDKKETETPKEDEKVMPSKKDKKEKKEAKEVPPPEPVLALKDISLDLNQKNRLVMVVGRVGSGKSALMQSIVNQLYLSRGTSEIVGSVAYVSQTAWVMNATVKENILFGKPFDSKLYDDVLDAVSLRSDLKILPAGEDTEIGERGINLSGGQKQRVALARALYANREIYLLDDPLSAVDAHVGKHIFDHGIQEMLKDKLVILVTNNLQYLPEADHIIYFEKGEVIGYGSFSKLKKSNEQFKSLMNEFGVVKNKKTARASVDLASDVSMLQTVIPADDKTSKQYQVEEKEVGAVAMNIYWYYIKKAGYVPAMLTCLFLAMNAAVTIAGQWWLQYWPRDYLLNYNTSNAKDTSYYVGIYGGISMSGIVFLTLTFVAAVRMVFNASRRLHRLLVSNVIFSPIAFFDTTPMGRILARFSTDMSIVEFQLLNSIWGVLDSGFNFIGSIVSVSLGATWILLALPLFILCYYFLQSQYRKSSIEIQRLEAVTRAPLYSQVSETLTGISIIRAYQMEKEFAEKNLKKLDIHNSVFFSLRFLSAWLAMMLSFCGAILQIVLRLYTTTYQVGLLAVAVSVAPQITFVLKYLSMSITTLEIDMNSIERIKEYSKLPKEGESTRDASPPPEDWPSKGKIDLESVSYRYRPNLPIVLKKVSLSIKGGERIGIVGRTGSGKSTLMGALYRLAELAGGKILIDDLDISKIPLEHLRSKLSIIPQEPQMFVGTIRYNLDPFQRASDAELWNAISIAGLKEKLKLDDAVKENGSNFAVGERQLFCLARALLRKSRILLLDEATASVDVKSDELVQKAIRNSFSDVTLLVIAHRLNTVMDMNRILVLSDGDIAEFDSPKALLANSTSVLYGMVHSMGRSNARFLTDLANGKKNIIDALRESVEMAAVDNGNSPQTKHSKGRKRSKKTKAKEEDT